MFAHKLTQQSFRGVLVASALDQCVKNKPILIDRAPKPMFRTIDCDDDFIEMPFVAELRRAAADFIGEVPTKFLRPTPHGFMADDNPPHGQHVFNHPQAERETKIEPNRVGDHLGGETMTTVQGVMSFHPRSIPAPLPHSVNVTVPHRNLLAHAPERLHEEISADYTDMIYAATKAEIETRRKAFIRKWRLKHRAVADSLEEAGDRLFTFARFPPDQWRSIRTTNAIERLHEEFKRRIKTQTVLPSAETAAMLFWALLASGQITMRKVDGWKTLADKPSDQPIDLAA